MNHPKPEDWVCYLYREASPELRSELQSHLDGCPECREQVQTLKSTMTRLDSWKVPRSNPAFASFAPALKWAVAACLVLCIGFSAGRLTAKPNMEQIRATLVPELRRELKQEFTEMVQAEVDRASAATLNSAAEHANKVAETYAQTVYTSLKQDVDTVALHADAGLRQTARQLIELADNQPNETAPHP